MYQERSNIKKEQQQIIGIVPAIDMKHFVLLLLADLASKSPIIYFNDCNIKTACLSSDYKRIIQDIMYQENGWGIKFAELIDIYSYYEFQLDWEKKLGITVKKVLKELNKDFEYDFENDEIKISFTQEEIDNIKNMYDQETLTIMDHFSSLVNDYIFKRSFNINRKDMQISGARYQYRLEELALRVSYNDKASKVIKKTKGFKNICNEKTN